MAPNLHPGPGRNGKRRFSTSSGASDVGSVQLRRRSSGLGHGPSRRHLRVKLSRWTGLVLLATLLLCERPPSLSALSVELPHASTSWRGLLRTVVVAMNNACQTHLALSARHHPPVRLLHPWLLSCDALQACAASICQRAAARTCHDMGGLCDHVTPSHSTGLDGLHSHSRLHAG